MWWMGAALAAEPPEAWSALREANPGLTLVVLGAHDRAEVEGWCDVVVALDASADPAPVLGRLDAAGCAVLARLEAEEWNLLPSASCAAPAPLARPEPTPPEPEPPAEVTCRLALPGDADIPRVSVAEMDASTLQRVGRPEVRQEGISVVFSPEKAEGMGVVEADGYEPAAIAWASGACFEPIALAASALDEDEDEDDEDLPRPRKEDDGGLLTFGALYGGYAGAEAGWLIGEAVEESEAAHTTAGLWPGLLGGSIIGLSTAYILDQSRDLRSESEALLFTSSAHGLLYGAQMARALIPPDAPGADERIHAAGLAGSMLGVGIGVALGDKAAPVGDQVQFSIATGIGWIAASGINDLSGLGVSTEDRDGDGIKELARYDRRPRAGVTLATTAVFDGIGMLGNRVARPGPWSLGLSIGHGMWIGSWSPLLFTDDPEARQITGGLRLGLGAGYASALLLAAAGEPDARSAGLQIAGWGAASALGAGIPLSLPGEGPAAAVVAPMLISGVAGQVLGAVVAPHYDLQMEDGLLLGTLGAWTAYQSIGWGTYASFTTDEPRRPFGYALSAGGAGSLVALGLTPLLDVPPAGSMVLLSSGGWGTWYGGWASQLSHLDPEGVWAVTLASGNGALVISGVAQAAGWKPDWIDLAAIDGLGLMGAAAGGLVGVIFLYDPDNLDPLVISTLAGSSLGLAAGGYVAARSDGSGSPRLLPIRAPRLRASLNAMPLPGERGAGGAYVQLDVREVR